uniref:Macaca fascicularis brain cDNA clone: QmoA-10507, similar to human protein phosphatase 1, regulatory (inhibitor) subunit15B (PPP1R15B), mRNA, RefSeq: NM_032833.2 n=1 Tax=Macaca fascicularis TaxID=9541 RepID=I7GP65_MACFA|nr:unnamed protein product [Macaca fascicularis]
MGKAVVTQRPHLSPLWPFLSVTPYFLVRCSCWGAKKVNVQTRYCVTFYLEEDRHMSKEER